MNKEALIIFIKNPQPGKVKTRIAATTGDEKALEIYKHLLQYTCRITKDLPQDKWLFYSEFIDEKDSWSNDIYHKQIQSGDDLGQKMLNAFKFCFDKGYEKISIIGSDMMEISASTLHNAFAQLKKHDIVIGPAKDGGYYLLGMNKLHPILFQNKSWSTSTVMTDTLADSKKLGLTHYELPTLCDIDTEADWNAYLKSQE